MAEVSGTNSHHEKIGLPDPVDIARITSSLQKNQDGVWVSQNQEVISYPEEGNQNCLALEADSFWFEHRSRCIEAAIRRFPPPGPIFDVGGGNGYVAAGLQRAGIPVVLLEPGLDGIRNARKRGITNLVCSTLEDAGFHDQALPGVGLFDVLEHISAAGDFLRTIHRLLVPGGRLYLTVPAYQALWSAADDYAGHHQRYTTASLSRMLSNAGFQVEYSTYLFWMLPLPVLLFRAVPSRLGLQKPADWQRYQQEHASRPGLAGRFLELLLRWELEQVRKIKRLPLGGSCLVVARK